MGVLDGRLPGYLGIANITPVELPEPRMMLDVLTVIPSPQSLGRVWI